MAEDVAVLGIGLDISGANSNANKFEKSLLDIVKASEKTSKTSESMSKSFLTANLAMEALNKTASFLSNQFGSIISSGAEFEQKMANVGAVSKANAETLNRLTESALKMGETTVFTATESAEALEAMSMAGLKAEQSIAALPNVLNLSAASGIALGESANIITNIMSSMGKKTEDLAHINNVLVETFTSTNTTLSGLGQTISYAGGIAETTGVSIEYLSAAAGILGNAGIDAGRAGRTLRQAMVDLVKPTKEAQETLDKLGVESGKNLIETLTQLEAVGASTTDIIKIFGAETGSSLLTLKQAGGIDAVKNLAENLRQVGDVADEVAKKQLDTFQGKMTLLGSAVDGVRQNIFQVFSEDDFLKNTIDKLTASVTKNKDEFLKVAGSMKTVSEFVVSLANDVFNANDNFSGLADIMKVVGSGVILVAGSFEALGTQIGYAASRFYDFTQGNFKEAAAGFYDAFKEGESDIKKISDALNNLWNPAEKAAKIIESTASKVSLMGEAAKISAVKVDGYTKEEEKAIEKTKEAYESALSLNNELEKQSLVSDIVTNSIKKQSEAISQVSSEYEKAAEKADKFANAQARPSGTFSGSSLVGQTFTVTTGFQGASISEQSQIQQSGGISQTSSILSDYERTSKALLDYINKDKTIELKLADAKSQLLSITDELTGLGNTELEKQLELTNKYIDTMKDIDSLQSQILRDEENSLKAQKSSAEGLNSILTGVLAGYNEISTGDLSQALPVDKLKALESQFLATSKAIDTINWQNITSADTQLISQFQNVSKEFLNQAQLVFKSSDNYQTIKTSVQSEFDDLASKITVAMAGADPKTFTDNLGTLKTALAGVSGQTITSATTTGDLSDKLSAYQIISGQAKDKTDSLILSTATLSPVYADSEAKSSLFAQTLAKLESQFVNTDTSASDATTSAGNLSQAMAGTQSPLATANQNFSTVANNTATTVDFIAKKFADLKTAIDSGATTVGGGTTVPITPTKTFTGYSKVNNLWRAVYSDSSYDVIQGVYSDWKNVAVSGGNLSYSDFLGNHLFVNGVRSYSSGSWNVSQNQLAQLHKGEMVIRADDAPSVRSYMKTSGASSGYGVSSNPVSNDRVVELLSELVEIIKTMPAPNVFLNSRKVSEELSRFQAVSA